MSKETLFSPRTTPCINYRSGCSGMVTKRGSVLCDHCIEERKMVSKRKEVEFDELMLKCKKLEEDLEFTKKRCDELIQNNGELLEKPVKTENINYYEKELDNLIGQNCRLKLENEALIAEKSRYELLYSQAKIDVEQIQLEKEKIENDLQSTIKSLQEKLQLLESENIEQEENPEEEKQ